MPMGEGSHRTMEKRIAVIGSGNVATHLATAVEGVVQICSPNLANAAALAEKVGCDATNSTSGLADADIYIVAVNDDAIAAVLESVPARCRKALWMHTSGSVGKSVFDGLGYGRYGVFYPLQTFSKSVDLDMNRVPFFIEGSDERTADEIRQLALSVSTAVYIADSHLRQQMHVAAVFACNFSNYMYTLADDVLQRNNLPFSVMKPLLEETLRKACSNGPERSQTGPAARGDRKIIANHEAMLDGERLDIYETVSNAILKRYNK